MTKFKYKLTSPLLMWAIVILGGLVLWKIAPEGRIFNSSIFGIIIFALALLNWAYVYVVTFRIHPKAPTSVTTIDKLITEGTYAIVRHPLYISDVILGLSVLLLDPLYKVMAIVIWLIIVLLFWSNLEERLLEEKFLEDYRAYKKRVPKFVPKIWK